VAGCDTTNQHFFVVLRKQPVPVGLFLSEKINQLPVIFVKLLLWNWRKCEGLTISKESGSCLIVATDPY
jgi:hypothetical protein